MPPLEAWEKVLIAGDDADAFFGSVHGEIPCVECHQGDDRTADKATAHANMVTRPSAGTDNPCAFCHAEVATVAQSLHGTLKGEKTFLAQRYGVASFAELPHAVQEGYEQECFSCHATCGSCHVSRPASVGGGLVASHLFGEPDMTENCTACHGSRIGEEYRGDREGYGADVHFVPGGMKCQDCHGATEMHASAASYDHRLEVQEAPTCESCHADVMDDNLYHLSHGDDLQCQVCHSQDYKSCNRCHAGEGLAEPSYIDFKIGLNPVPELRSYTYVLLRHIPVATDTYAEWGVPVLAEFDVLPTWKYTAPHNIRRWTDRTEVPEGGACGDACHGTPDENGFFLRQADLDAMGPEEADANRHLIVPDGSPVNW